MIAMGQNMNFDIRKGEEQTRHLRKLKESLSVLQQGKF